jgi:hypothetical protein
MRPPRWPLVTAALLLVAWNLFLLTMVFYGN